MTKTKTPAKLWDRFLDIFSDEEDPDEPVYDPVHLGGTVIISLAGIGCLYWLLWTLLVFEGGIQTKVCAAAQVLFTSKTMKDFGYEGSPYAMGAFEGWFGSLVALLIAIGVVVALHRLYKDASRRASARPKGK